MPGMDTGAADAPPAPDAIDPLLWLGEAAGPELARFNLETDFETPAQAEDAESPSSGTGSSEGDSSERSGTSTPSDWDEGLPLVVSKSRPPSRPPSRGMGIESLLGGTGTDLAGLGGPRAGLSGLFGGALGLGGLGSLGGLGIGGLGVPAGAGAYGLSGLGMPSPLLDMPFAAPSEASPILTLTLETLIMPQLDIFYARIYPMMPVYTHSELLARLADPRSLADRTFAALVLAKVALSLVHPLTAAEMEQRTHRARQATTLLDEVCRLRAGWEYGCVGSVEAVLTSYCLFGTLFELGHADGARFRLLEAIVMGHVMRLGDPYAGAPEEARRRMRMYWILAITERAYALQRSATSLVFGGAINAGAQEGEGASLHHLARVFSVIDADVLLCWNGACAGRCRLTRTRASRILRKLQGSAAQVFGGEEGLLALTEAQKADLLITWQWMRNRIWRLAALHGLTGDEGPPELAPAYALDVAATAVAICRRLSLSAMEAHGVGFVEKLYDIASTVGELAQASSDLAVVRSADPATMLQALAAFVTRHRAGAVFAAPLAQAMNVANALRVLSGE